MFQRKRGDTLVGTIEAQYGINLNSRSDARLDNLLADRGFDSLSQLLVAYHCRATAPIRKRKLFLSFHHEDIAQVNGFRLMGLNPNLQIDFHDASVREPVNSENSSYVRTVINEKIARSSVVVCLIGNGTAWRDWVDWELDTARSFGKGLCGVRLKGARGRAPGLLREIDSPVAQWDMNQIVAVIESAAARRS